VNITQSTDVSSTIEIIYSFECENSNSNHPLIAVAISLMGISIVQDIFNF